MREAGHRLALLRARLDHRDTRIISPYAGKIVDLLITVHAPVQTGTTAALLRPVDAAWPGRGSEPIIFVPAGLGKKIRVGDVVEVAPDTVRLRPGARVHSGRDPLDLRNALHRPVDAGRAQTPHPWSRRGNFIEMYAGTGALRDHPLGTLHESRPLCLPPRGAHSPLQLGWTGRRCLGATSPSPMGRFARHRSSWSGGR